MKGYSKAEAQLAQTKLADRRIMIRQLLEGFVAAMWIGSAVDLDGVPIDSG
jgi:hypothetical protein